MSGATLSEIYQKARHSLLSVRDGVERLERFEFSSSKSSGNFGGISYGDLQDGPDLAQHLRREIAQLQQYSVEMDRLWRSISKPHRDLWKRKVEQIAEEADSLKIALDKYLNRQQRRQLEAKERAELFQRMNGNRSEGAQILQIHDDEMRALKSARNSSRMLEEAHATGAAILSKYAEQRDRLKHAQRKALDILNTVGLSNSVLKLVERRHRVDKWISYVGMAVTIIIVIVVWCWLRW